MIPLARPLVTEADIAAVNRVLRSGVLTQGDEIEALESKLAVVCNVQHAVAVSSGTAALHILMMADGIEEGDILFTTPFTFAASAMCALYTGASLRFVDIDAATWNMSTNALFNSFAAVSRLARQRYAVMAVDVFGTPIDIEAMAAICPPGVWLYEDAAEALGSSFDGAPCGSLARASVVAFYPNKQIVAGEGGAILTNDDRIAATARILRNNGREPMQHVITDLGYNYRMDEMSAALASSQLDRLPAIRLDRQWAASCYISLLAEVEELQLQAIPPGALVNPFVFVVCLRGQKTTERRDAIIAAMAEKGMQCRTYFDCLQRHPLFQKLRVPGETPVADAISNGAIALPFAQGITAEEITAVVGALKECLL